MPDAAPAATPAVSPQPAAAAPAVAAVAPSPVAAAAPAVPQTPSAAAPSPAPAPVVAEAAPAPAKTEAPAAPAGEPAKAPEPPTSLLSKTEEKPAPAAEGEKPPAEAAPAPAEAPAAAPPTYEAFVFPEGMKAGDKELGQYTSALGEYELAIAKDPAQVHGETQKLGQKLVDMHIADLKRVKQVVEDSNRETFFALQNQWIEDFRKDPEIGGNRFDTTLNNALGVIREYAGSDKHLAQLRMDLKYTGAANLPSVIRLLNNIGKALSEGKPVAAVLPTPQVEPKQAPKNRRYAGSIPQKG